MKVGGDNGGNSRAYCWFHGNPTNSDCFIGFKDASIPLTQPSENNTSVDYEQWFKRVVLRLTYSHYTIIQALNSASNCWFDCDYDETELYLGFTAKWGEDPSQWGEGKMKIYGNWNIDLY